MAKITKYIPQKIKNLGHKTEAEIYNALYKYPSRKLKIIGVTGTDGKTTTSSMIYEILKTAGKKVGMVTTLKAQILDKEYPVGFHVTTPSPKLLQKFLKDMVENGLEYVVLETTSHGLDQFRVGGIKYIAAVYTNVTKEHLDYHKTYANYLRAKAKLISQTKKDGFCVLNKDDFSFETLKEIAVKENIPVLSYGIDNDALVKGDIVSDSIFTINTEIYAEAKGKEIQLKLPGKYNVSNALAAITTSLRLGIGIDDIKKALENIPIPEGRWEIIQEKPFKVVVDFAHTPNALENMLNFARKSVEGKGNVIVVFGCAGLRDFYKRPMMGEIAGRLADIVIITAEDPRTEDINKINAQIEEGLLKNSGRKKEENYFVINDRKKAIEKALQLAKKGDLIVTTGKGHEKSMNLDGKKEISWNEQEIVRKLIEQKMMSSKKAISLRKLMKK